VGLKPSACFTTIPESTENNGLIRPALKKSNSLKRTLKKVAWRKTIFEIKDTASSSSTVVNDDQADSTTLTSMLYPLGGTSSLAGKEKQADRSPSSSTSTNCADGRHPPSIVSLQDFYLLKLIGKGNFGKVMLAQHKDIHQVFAIKVISKSSVKRKSQKSSDGDKPVGSNPHDIDHIMAERNVLIRSINHPFLIGLRWAFQTTEKLYFVTDYVNGGELFFHLQRERRFSELRARFYTAEIVSALEYLHVEVDVVYRYF
jgi:hypothetical protein